MLFIHTCNTAKLVAAKITFNYSMDGVGKGWLVLLDKKSIFNNGW